MSPQVSGLAAVECRFNLYKWYDLEVMECRHK
jgi:hypothetical protein